MLWPGPPSVPWGLALLFFGVALLPTGELIRRVGARFAGAWRIDDPIERAVLDLFLGAAPLYVLGSLPGALYVAALPSALVLAGGAGLLLWLWAERRRGRPGPFTGRFAWERLAEPGTVAVLAGAGLLYLLFFFYDTAST